MSRENRLSTQSGNSGYARFPGKKAKKKRNKQQKAGNSFDMLWDDLLTIDIERLKPAIPIPKAVIKNNKASKITRKTGRKNGKSTGRERSGFLTLSRKPKQNKHNKKRKASRINRSNTTMQDDVEAVNRANSLEGSSSSFQTVVDFQVPKFIPPPPGTVKNTIIENRVPLQRVGTIVSDDGQVGVPATFVPPPVSFGGKEPKMLPQLAKKKAEKLRESERREQRRHKAKSASTPASLNIETSQMEPVEQQRRSEIPLGSSNKRLNSSLSSLRISKKGRPKKQLSNEIARLQGTMTRKKKAGPPGLTQSNHSLPTVNSQSSRQRQPPPGMNMNSSMSTIEPPSPRPRPPAGPPPGAPPGIRSEGRDEIARLMSTMKRKKNKG